MKNSRDMIPAQPELHSPDRLSVPEAIPPDLSRSIKCVETARDAVRRSEVTSFRSRRPRTPSHSPVRIIGN